MQLKFLAREDLLVREAGIHPRIGQATRYYGRAFNADTKTYDAVKEPFVVEADSEDGQKCARQCREGSLWAADDATAAAIGVAFVATEFTSPQPGAACHHVAKVARAKAPQSTKEAS